MHDENYVPTGAHIEGDVHIREPPSMGKMVGHPPPTLARLTWFHPGLHVQFIQTNLAKWHTKFFYLSADRLYGLLKSTDPQRATAGEKTTARCEFLVRRVRGIPNWTDSIPDIFPSRRSLFTSRLPFTTYGCKGPWCYTWSILTPISRGHTFCARTGNLTLFLQHSTVCSGYCNNGILPHTHTSNF